MTNAQWLGAHSVDDYQLYSLGHYPGAVPGEGTVHGEVYRIDASTLAELDALRTKGGEYARHLIQTPYGSAWMYVYQRSVEGCTLIANGNWLDRDHLRVALFFITSVPMASFWRPDVWHNVIWPDVPSLYWPPDVTGDGQSYGQTPSLLTAG